MLILDPYRIMGVHDNLVLFLNILDNRFFPDKGFNFGRVVYSSRVATIITRC